MLINNLIELLGAPLSVAFRRTELELELFNKVHEVLVRLLLLTEVGFHLGAQAVIDSFNSLISPVGFLDHSFE